MPHTIASADISFAAEETDTQQSSAAAPSVSIAELTSFSVSRQVKLENFESLRTTYLDSVTGKYIHEYSTPVDIESNGELILEYLYVCMFTDGLTNLRLNTNFKDIIAERLTLEEPIRNQQSHLINTETLEEDFKVSTPYGVSRYEITWKSEETADISYNEDEKCFVLKKEDAPKTALLYFNLEYTPKNYQIYQILVPTTYILETDNTSHARTILATPRAVALAFEADQLVEATDLDEEATEAKNKLLTDGVLLTEL